MITGRSLHGDKDTQEPIANYIVLKGILITHTDDLKQIIKQPWLPNSIFSTLKLLWPHVLCTYDHTGYTWPQSWGLFPRLHLCLLTVHCYPTCYMWLQPRTSDFFAWYVESMHGKAVFYPELGLWGGGGGRIMLGMRLYTDSLHYRGSEGKLQHFPINLHHWYF